MAITSKFILADNQDITRIGMQHVIINTFDENAEITHVSTRSSLIKRLSDNDITAVVIDIATFDLNTTDELQNLASRFQKTIWILFSNEISEAMARRLGADSQFSMLLKDSHSEEIRSALKFATIGERFICNSITSLLLSGNVHAESLESLTQTEIEVLKLTAQGMSVKEIANERNSSTHTITTHKKNIFRKLSINTSYEATRYAVKAGLVDLVEYYI